MGGGEEELGEKAGPRPLPIIAEETLARRLYSEIRRPTKEGRRTG